MKLSDQEQVVLKAIGSGVAEVSRVIRSVGYPKATVKKVLLRLSEKGAVNLHRHDWPASLKPEQRKLMVRIGSNYYGAVSVRKRNPKSKGKTALKKTGRALKGFARGALGAGAQILGAGAEALNPSRRRKKAAKKRNKTVIKAKRVLVLNPKKKRVKRNASRTVHARRTAAKRRSGVSRQTGRKKATAKVRSVAKARKASTRRTTSNPTRKGMRKGYREAKRISKITRGRYFSSESGQRKAARHEKRQERKSKRNNPSAESIRKEFAGKHDKDSKLYFPDGTPTGLAKLGKLILIETKSGPIELNNLKGEVWLCADTHKRFHLGSTIKAPLFDGPARNLGEVKMIEYQEAKPHLGYRKTIWFHEMGEEGGRRPTLHANSKGELKFKGGDYRITTRGIEN